MSLSPDRLREQCLPSNADTVYARAIVDGILAANAFACRWQYKDQTVCWITQLVVKKGYRQDGLATTLLLALRSKQYSDDIYGIMSSHPAACMAAAKAFGGESVSTHTRVYLS